ncbi:MAG: DUF488 domain-containing protein [Candidatus Zixiibacteriota bacterium]
MGVQLKRIYEPPSRLDGYRVLVDRLWPRGVSKEKARIDRWLKDAAPSPTLRAWFCHDPEKWGEFRKAYLAELKDQKAATDEIVAMARRRTVTLVYAAADTEHTHAKVLKEYLQRRLR